MASNNICKPVNPYLLQPPGIIKSFPEEQYELLIRPFCVTTDLDEVCRWIEREQGSPGPIENSRSELLLQSYVESLQSTFSQPLFCLSNDVGVCQADISKALNQEVSMHLDTNEGDYTFQMIMAPYPNIPKTYVNIVKTYLEYFFSFDEVKRVLTFLPVSDEWNNHLMECAGFRYLDTLQMISGTCNLCECRKTKISSPPGTI
jgi:hypothetical protein